LGPTFEREPVDADIVISQPFWPATSRPHARHGAAAASATTAGSGRITVDLQARFIAA
jgi:hypothetical protein